MKCDLQPISFFNVIIYLKLDKVRFETSTTIYELNFMTMMPLNIINYPLSSLFYMCALPFYKIIENS
jgi:hypothetical protein